MFAGVEIISVSDGFRQDASCTSQAAVIQPRTLLGLKGDQSRLLILSDPLHRDGSDTNRTVVDIISSTYLRESSGSVTSRLTRALREANRALCAENSKTLPHQRHHLNVLCAIIRPTEAFFAQVGPSIIVLIRGGGLRRLGEKSASTLSASCLGQDFGFEAHYSHTTLETGDIIILSSPGLARIASGARLLSCVAGRGQESLADVILHLHQTAPTNADLTSILVEVRHASDKRQARQEGSARPQGGKDAEPDAPAEPTRSLDVLRPQRRRREPGQSGAQPSGRGAVPFDELARSNPPEPPCDDLAGDARAVDADVPPFLKSLVPQGARTSSRSTHAPSPAASGVTAAPLPIRDVVIEFKGSKADGEAVARAISRSIAVDPPGDRAAAAAAEGSPILSNRHTKSRPLLTSTLWSVAVLVTLAIVGFLFLRGYQAVEQQLSRPTIDQVAPARAAVVKNAPDAVVDSRHQAELDKLNSVLQLSNPNVLVDLSRETAPAESLSMQMQGIDIYLLNRVDNRVYKYLLDDSGNRVQPSANPILLRKGDSYVGVTVNDLVGMTWIPAGGARSRGALITIDSRGTAFEYDHTKGISPMRLARADILSKQSILTGYAGNLYVLDPQNGKLLWYPPSAAGYSDNDYSYFGPQTSVELSTAVDFALDGNLFLLHRTGRVEKFSGGRPQLFEAVLPDSPIKAPTHIFLPQVSQSVYVVDAGNSRVVQLGKDGAFQRQFQYRGTEDVVRGAKGISVDEQRGTLYILSGKKILSFTMGTKQP